MDVRGKNFYIFCAGCIRMFSSGLAKSGMPTSQLIRNTAALRAIGASRAKKSDFLRGPKSRRSCNRIGASSRNYSSSKVRTSLYFSLKMS